MDDMKIELSARYYIAEVTVGLLSAILIVARVIGLAPSQPLPVLKVMLEDNQNYLRIVAMLLIASIVYLIFEWMQSSQQARGSYWAKARAGLVLLFACISLWLCYPLITAGTPFARVLPTWYLGFVVIGFLLGQFVSNLAFMSLMIRTPAEAKIFHLPRIPVVPRTQIRVWVITCLPWLM